jgi:hypothetical protein
MNSGASYPALLKLAVKKRKYYKVQSEPILGKWQHCQNPQMPIFSHLF